MPQEHTCPRCRVPLQQSEIDDPLAHIDDFECTACGGRFFRAGDLEKLDDIIAPRFVEIRRIPAAEEQGVPLECPFCDPGTLMTKLEHERDRKVVLDICPSCRGTWLDRGELAAIQQEGLLVFLVNTFRWAVSIL